MTENHDRLFIGGDWVSPSSGSTIAVTCASTEEALGSVAAAQETDVDAAVAAARDAFHDPSGWAAWEPAARADAMERLAGALDARASEMASRVSTQNGMPISIATGLEGGFPQMLLRYYAGLCRSGPPDETRDGLLGGKIRVRHDPVGVVGAIVPWNYPQTLLAFKLGPGLAAGCTFVIKPSPETVLDAQLFAEAVVEAGLPAGVINIVPGGREIGAYLVDHPDIHKVAFTGSTAAGRSIAEVCGRRLRPVSLELGGKSAAIFLEDVDLQDSLPHLFGATLMNNGQTCYLSTRILAPAGRYDEIVDAISEFVGSLTVGDAMDPHTQIGPMVSALHRERVEGYIAKGKGEGGRLTVGGGRPVGLDKGWFVEPTVFADVDNNHTIAQEEIFGPVLSIIKYSDLDDAIRIANDSAYGLGGSIWTADKSYGVEVAARVQTGTVGVNAYMPDPAAPFGGVKSSGLGRELGPEALASYRTIQSIYH